MKIGNIILIQSLDPGHVGSSLDMETSSAKIWRKINTVLKVFYFCVIIW